MRRTTRKRHIAKGQPILHEREGENCQYLVTDGEVEIRLIDPPEDIKRTMYKQKTAEQERRSMRLLATDEFEAAEQQKLAIIQRAEGEREAVIQVAQGKVEAIQLVTRRLNSISSATRRR